MSIQTVASGEIYLEADLNLDGGDASNEDGYGGLGALNPWDGRSSNKLNGNGPVGLDCGELGVSASYGYGDEQITHLLAEAVDQAEGIIKVPGRRRSLGA